MSKYTAEDTEKAAQLCLVLLLPNISDMLNDYARRLRQEDQDAKGRAAGKTARVVNGKVRVRRAKT